MDADAIRAGRVFNDRIAARQCISTETARTHIGRAMQKLGARDRAQLVIAVFESGLAGPDLPPGP